MNAQRQAVYAQRPAVACEGRRPEARLIARTLRWRDSSAGMLDNVRRAKTRGLTESWELAELAADLNQGLLLTRFRVEHHGGHEDG
jgi:hypothetical protein